MQNTEEYLKETKLITDTFQNLFTLLQKRQFNEAYYFLSLAYDVYMQELSQELKQKK